MIREGRHWKQTWNRNHVETEMNIDLDEDGKFVLIFVFHNDRKH
jgi:hypothetical protein